MPSVPSVTASKAHLVLECARALAVESDGDIPGEPALYGIALHDAVDPIGGSVAGAAASYAAATGADYETTLVELQQHATRVLMLVKQELIDNGWSIESTECSRAWNPFTNETRSIVLDRKTHTYIGLDSDEIGGTADVVLRNGHRTMVLDYKTGHWGDFHDPASLTQLRVLGEMWEASDLAILHCPRQAPAVLYQAETRTDTDAWVATVQAAMRRRGDGSLRPGAWCRFCPARSTCIAHSGEVLQAAASMIRRGTQELTVGVIDPGTAHLFLERLARLADLAREHVRAAVEASDTPITRPDGKVLQFVESTRETISRRGILTALGEVAGQRLLDELRSAGAVKETTSLQLRAVKEK